MVETKNKKHISLLERIAIFGGLELEQQIKLLGLMEERKFVDGECVFKKGEDASNIYVVVKGQVLLDFEQDDHPLSDIIIDRGYCFGETSLVGVQSHVASTYAKGDTHTLILSGQTLYGLYQSDIELFASLILNIAREASRRLHATDELFLRYSQMKELKKLPYLGF